MIDHSAIEIEVGLLILKAEQVLLHRGNGWSKEAAVLTHPAGPSRLSHESGVLRERASAARHLFFFCAH